MNNVKVFVLMAGLTGLLVALGGTFGGQSGAVLMVGVSALMNFVMYFGSSKMVLRMYGAHVVTEQQAPELYQMVDRLRQRAGLPMPTVAVAPHEQPNAFATGRNPENAVVCVTEGILKLVSREELEGVIAHELAHIKNRDMLLQTFTATMAGAISMLGGDVLRRERAVRHSGRLRGLRLLLRPRALRRQRLAAPRMGRRARSIPRFSPVARTANRK